MEDGTSLKSKSTTKKVDYKKKGPNNVAININSFIAKYDFEIAAKLKRDFSEKEQKETVDESDDGDEELTTEEKIQIFKTNAILEILQICSNELAADGEYY